MAGDLAKPVPRHTSLIYEVGTRDRSSPDGPLRCATVHGTLNPSLKDIRKESTMSTLLEFGSLRSECQGTLRGFILESLIIESPPGSGLCWLGKVFDPQGIPSPVDCQ